MIRLNLLDEKVDKTGLYLLQGLAAGVALFLATGACFLNYQSMSSKLSLLESEKESLETKLKELKKVTLEVEGLEEKKGLLREKLLTIANLKANKSGPVQLLDDLNLAIPDRAWLENVKQSEGKVEIEGVALDNQTVSDFMENLEASDFFSGVDLGYSNQIEKDNVKLQSFALVAKRVSQLEIQKAKRAASTEEGESSS